MVRFTIVATVTLMLAVPTFAQNLLENPGFDVADQLDGWICTSTDGVASWSALDHWGLVDSGSLQHDVDAAANNGKIWCVQCVPVTESYSYIASGWYYWPDDPDVDQLGTTRWSVSYYGDPNCTSYISVGTNKIVSAPTLDTWHFLESDETTAPAGATAALVYFISWQNLIDQPIRVRLDDLDFSRAPIFRDGFETGDVSAWSDSVP